MSTSTTTIQFTSVLHFFQSCTSTLFSPHCLISMSSSAFLCFFHCPHHTTCIVHPVTIIFLQHMSQPPWVIPLNIKVQSPFSPSALHLVLYNPVTRHTSIAAFSSLSTQFILYTLHPWPKSGFLYTIALLKLVTPQWHILPCHTFFLVKISDSSLNLSHAQ